MFLEHVNLTVTNLDRAREFYSALLGFETRWEGTTNSGRRAAHIGDDRCYLALFENPDGGPAPFDYDRTGLNHFGFVVDDLEAARRRVEDLGAEVHLEGDYDPGRRLYTKDPDGIEIELVEYAHAPKAESPAA